jgi:hypothetical protein
MVSVWIAALGLVLAAGCGAQDTSAKQNPWSSPSPGFSQSQLPGPSAGPNQDRPPDCIRNITQADEVPAALANASPGSTLCFTGGELGGTNPPHPDCFQTYDDNSPPTFDVLIAGNNCHNVDAQCLIATGDQRANSAAPTAGPFITFIDNTCDSGGAQAVNLRRWPNVEIRNNKISGPHVTRGIIIIDGSTGCVVIGNTTDGGRPTVDIDRSSRPGSRVENNSPR